MSETWLDAATDAPKLREALVVVGQERDEALAEIATLRTRAETAEAEVDALRLLIAGGEDAPGHAATMTVDEAQRVLRQRAETAEAELSEALDKIDGLESDLSHSREWNGELIAERDEWLDDYERQRDAGDEARAECDAMRAAGRRLAELWRDMLKRPVMQWDDGTLLAASSALSGWDAALEAIKGDG